MTDNTSDEALNASNIADLRFLTERYQYALMATEDTVWDWDIVSNTVWRGDYLYKVFGYSVEAVNSTVDFWSNAVHPDDRERVVNGIQEAIRSGQVSWSDEYRFRKADGTYAIVQDRGYVRRDSEARAIRMIGSTRDITSAKMYQEKFIHETERLRLALESTEIGTFDFDPRTGVLLWDKKCKELFGLSPNAHVDWSVFLKGLHPEDRERTDKINSDAMADGSDGFYDVEYRTIGIEDNRLRWIRAKGRSYFDSNGKSIRYIGTVLDITEQKLYEQNLVEQEQLFRLLATSIPEIVWMTDNTGKTTYISERWEYYTGISREVAAPDFTSAIHADDLNEITTRWQTSVATGTAWAGMYRLLDNRTGHYRWFSGTVAPLKDRHGNITRWIGSAGDIHDHKMNEQELEKRVQDRTEQLAAINVQLQQSNRELEQFAYVASHDLQEPLRKVSTYLGLVKASIPSPFDPTAESYFHKIERSVSRMSSLIKNLLAYSKVDKDNVAFEDVDLNNTVADVISDFEVSLTQKSIAVTVDKLPTVHAVSYQMNQLFHNLIGNAIKFSKASSDSFIRITCETVNGIINDDSTTNQGPRYRISIADNGIGFDPKYSTKMFEIFQRLDTPKPVSGHGIGLAICQKILNNHHGSIWADGRAGEGAVFFIDLPV